MQELLRLEPPSSLEGRVRQAAPEPLFYNWRPSTSAAGGVLPELAHPVGGLGVRLWAGSWHGVDLVDLLTALELCTIAQAYYAKEVRS